MTWKINGTDLDTASVKVTMPGGLQFTEAMRRQDQALVHATSRSHLLGRDLPAWKFRLLFTGIAPNRYDRLLVVRNLIRENATFLLEAPASSEIYFENGLKDIDLSLVRLRVDYLTGLGAVALDVDCVNIDPDDATGP